MRDLGRFARRCLALVALAMVGVVVGPAVTHTGFESSDPTDGATVTGSLDEITIPLHERGGALRRWVRGARPRRPLTGDGRSLHSVVATVALVAVAILGAYLAVVILDAPREL